MNYFIMTDLVGLVPSKYVNEALDDDGDGAADSDVFAQLQVDAGNRIHALLGGRYTTPFTNAIAIPDIVTEAATLFAAEQLYTRRGKDAPSGISARVKDVTDRLQKIGAGTLPLDPRLDRADPSVSVIAGKSRLGGRQTNV